MSADQKPQNSSTKCEACGEPATRIDAEGVPLCEGDYQHLLEHWRLEGFGDQTDGE